MIVKYIILFILNLIIRTMKYFNFCLFVLILCFASCSNDDVFYSCDPTVDQWAKDNIEEIRTMNLSEWLEIGNPDYQRAAFVAFTPEQRLDFWLQRMDDVLSLSWSSEEAAHIEEIKALLQRNAAIFQNDYSDDVRKTFDTELYMWTEKAETELGWSKELISNLITTAYPLVDTKGTVLMPPLVSVEKTRSEQYCECHAGNTVFVACPNGKRCLSHPCTLTTHGCGAFFAESCNGLCL